MTTSSRHPAHQQISTTTADVTEKNPRPCSGTQFVFIWRSTLDKHLASQWLANDKQAVAEVRGILKDRGLDADSIMAQALSDKLREVERIDTMIASANARRNKALVEIERRRDTVVRRLRTIANGVTNIDQT